MYGVLAAAITSGEHALKAVSILAVVVQQAAQPRELGESFVSWPGGRGQLAGKLSDRLEMDGKALPSDSRIGISGLSFCGMCPKSGARIGH
jgi:hypothetical protein